MNNMINKTSIYYILMIKFPSTPKIFKKLYKNNIKLEFILKVV